MLTLSNFKTSLAATACAAALATTAAASDFNIPSGDLEAALNAYSKQAGIRLMYSDEAVRGVHTRGVSGAVSPEDALTKLLNGTGFVMEHRATGVVTIVRDQRAEAEMPVNQMVELAQSSPLARGTVETVTVTSSKLGGTDVQSVPIAITAMSQEQLTATQTAGGPDLVKNVPNLTFSKTNFTGYNIQIRGIGTQAISATTDPAVAVSFNDVPFLRNHLFEQEFFDVSQVEVLRGPQGTLYGRNATSGVVNIISARPSDHYEAQASVDVGNYNSRRLEGMLNIPVLDDKIDLRVAGEWTKRDGYAFNEQTGDDIDGRDLWSTRVSLLVHPTQNLTATLIWEHFQENDNRARSTKQLCKRDNAPAVVDGPAGPQATTAANYGTIWIEQGCQPTSLYGSDAFQTPNAGAIPFIAALSTAGYIPLFKDVYAGLSQSPDLRVVSSAIDPIYTAKSDTYELNVDYNIAPGLTATSQTGYNQDHLYSTEDFNRFNTTAGLFKDLGSTAIAGTFVGQDGQFCDPQLGCSSRFVAQDISQEHARQFYQEVRVASGFKGPFNFIAGGNYLSYKTTFSPMPSRWRRYTSISFNTAQNLLTPLTFRSTRLSPIRAARCLLIRPL